MKQLCFVTSLLLLVGTSTAQTLRYSTAGHSAGDWFGYSVAGAGDVNGDGFDDFLVGLWQDDVNGVNSGSARVFSGIDGSVLYTVSGDSAGDAFGSSVACAGDVDGDGLADLVVGAWLDDVNGTESGSARVFLSDFATLPARVERLGLGCLASNGHLPTTELVGYPYVGQSLSLRLRGALPNALALFVLGSASVLDLASLGAPGCSLQASLDLIATFVTDANGLVTLNGIAIANNPALVGLSTVFQGAVFDPAANTFGFVTSNGVEATFAN